MAKIFKTKSEVIAVSFCKKYRLRDANKFLKHLNLEVLPDPASQTCWWELCCQGGGYQKQGCGLVDHTQFFLGSRTIKQEK